MVFANLDPDVHEDVALVGGAVLGEEVWGERGGADLADVGLRVGLGLVLLREYVGFVDAVTREVHVRVGEVTWGAVVGFSCWVMLVGAQDGDVGQTECESFAGGYATADVWWVLASFRCDFWTSDVPFRSGMLYPANGFLKTRAFDSCEFEIPSSSSSSR